MLSITCFNTFQATRNGQAISRFRSAKERALLIYLAVEQDRAHQRTTLAGLLWPDAPETTARHNLAQTLLNLRKAIGDSDAAPPYLLITAQTIAFNPASDQQVDVITFARQLSVGTPDAQHKAITLYHGPFLDGFSVSDSDLLDHWIMTQRERLQQLALVAFNRLCAYYEAAGEWQQVQQLLRRLLLLAPWHEEAHRQLMRLLARTGERTLALAQYDTLTQILLDELGVPPAAETDALYDQILAGEIAGPVLTPALALAIASPPLPAPPEPAQPPLIGALIGRQQELAYFAEQLARHNVAVISGMAGVGKTALAVRLAAAWQTIAVDVAPRRTKQIFWHSCHADEGVMTLIWQLAAFLAWHGQGDLWQMLQGARQSSGEPPPPAALLDYVLQQVRSQGYLLCFDDLHLIDDDPLIQALMKRLQPLLAQQEITVIVTTRHLPAYWPIAAMQPLTGLTGADLQQMAAVRGLALSHEWSARLYTHTEGNAQLVSLALNVLARAADPARVLDRLAEAADLERYLAKEVDDSLNDEERTVMIAVAVLLGYTADRALIECVSGQERLKRVLRDLTDRHLLTQAQSGTQDAYSAHAMVRAFYYDLPSRRERQAMHRRAARYYGEALTDPFHAALHYERAGDLAQAAALATVDVWGFINQGQARPLHQLLLRLSEHPDTVWGEPTVQSRMRININLALGQLCGFLSESGAAGAHYQAALTLLAAQPTTADHPTLHARIALGMGEAFRNTEPTAALTWLEGGVAAVAVVPQAVEPALVAALWIRAGNLHWILGQYGAAIAALEQGLRHLPPHPSQWRATALLNLGNVYDVQGHRQPARVAWEESLAISRQLHDYYWMTVATCNLGIALELAGDWSAAATRYQEALTLTARIGNRAQQARIENSLGLLYSKQGDEAGALALLTHALAFNRELGIRRELPYVLGSLAQVQIHRAEWAAATASLTEATAIARELKTRYPLVELAYLHALVALAQGCLTQAHAHVDTALQLATELASVVEAAIAHRVRGEIWAAAGESTLAVAAFAESLTHLTDRDPYEAACTQLAWGRVLISTGDIAQGNALLQQAQPTLHRLGARRELGEIALLQHYSG